MPRLRRSLLRRYRLFAPRLLSRGLFFLVLLLLLDGVATLYLSQIQAALSLDTPSGQQGINVVTPSVASMGEQPVKLASDTFQRPDQTYWGTSSGGQNWQADAQTDRNFGISHAVGFVRAAPGCVDCEAIVGPSVANVEVSFSASLNTYNSSALCAILRWDGATNLYKLVLDGQSLVLWRVMDGMPIPLQKLAFPARADAFYTFRFRAVGPQLLAMVWPTNQPQPVDWQISVKDNALNAGRAGIGVLVRQETQAKITAFTEVAL